jgi:protoporphyrinogen oxidase
MHGLDIAENRNDPVVIIGAGPAGLTAAMELGKSSFRSIVVEKDRVVGGLSRTVIFKGYRFDIGGHRFFTKVNAVNQFWADVLGHEFQLRSRQSRIYFSGRYFDYPLKLANVVLGLGLFPSFWALLSYIRAHVKPRPSESSLEDYLVNRFGRVLHETFFRTYTEKLWGMPCCEISADWAAQRIRGLSFYRAVRAALSSKHARKIKSLTGSFYYPRLGPGQMWETVEARINDGRSTLLKDTEAVSLRHTNNNVREVVIESEGKYSLIPSRAVISSMPLRELIEKLDPPAPPQILEAASTLRYRDFLTIALIIKEPVLFRDKWIYIHDPFVKVSRIQNYGNWSTDLVPIRGHSCLGLEYFCFEGDDIWDADDEDLLRLARTEVDYLKIADPTKVIDGLVVRIKKAYPIYDLDYRSKLKIIRNYLSGFTNLFPVGRNGLHKYNNQDHSMFTAMLAVRNLCGENHDIWAVNADCENHEEISGFIGNQHVIEGRHH